MKKRPKEFVISKNGQHAYWPCRCNQCNTRKTLRRNPDDYLKDFAFLKCPSKCGGVLRVDWGRAAGRDGGVTCHCDGYSFPHRKKSLYCDHYKGVKDDQFYESRYKSQKC